MDRLERYLQFPSEMPPVRGRFIGPPFEEGFLDTVAGAAAPQALREGVIRDRDRVTVGARYGQ